MKRILLRIFLVARWVIVVFPLIYILPSGAAYALPVYDTSAIGELTGNRTEDSGNISTLGLWASDGQNLTLNWVITGPVTGIWHYKYTLTNFDSPDISHFIISLSEACNGDPGCVKNANGSTDTQTYDLNGPGNSNPGFPAGASIFGVKLDFGGGAGQIYEFDSNRAPVYRDFYMKGGNNLPPETPVNAGVAYNAGLPVANHSSEDIYDFVARPDTTSTPIPEPATMLLLGSGLLGLAGYGRKKFRKK